MKKSVFIILLVFSFSVISHAQIVSASSGNWSSASTWAGGNIPAAGDNVQISSGHTVVINAIAACKSVSFADTSAHLQMGSATSELNIYGDFTLAAITHRVFNLWVAGAKIIFKGSADQKLSGWNPGGSSTSFMEMIIDKDSGKVYTDSTNMRFSFGTSLEIIKGTFELRNTDDIETRDISGTGTYGTVIIRSEGLFQMLGGTSHIRRGTFTDSVTKRTGKWTVYGKAVFSSSSSNFINLGGLDIEDGGQVNLNTGWSTGYFNPQNITVKSGGVLYNLTTTNIWHASAYVILEQGGEFNSATSTTPLPLNFINNNGTVRFSRSNDQTLPAGLTTFYNLFLSGSGVKTLSANITVNGTLSLRGTATMSLSTFTLTYGPNAILQYGSSGQISPQTTSDAEFPVSNGPQNITIYNTGGVTLHDSRTITGTLTLSAGVFDNNGASDDKILTMANNSTIRRNSGEMSAAPVLNPYNLEYGSTITKVTTGFEVSLDPSVLKNLTITTTKGIILGSDVTVNGTLSFALGASNINTENFVLKLNQNAAITGEKASSNIIGKVEVIRQLSTNGSDFGNVGFTVSSGSDNVGQVKVIRFTGTEGIITVEGKTSIARKFIVTADSDPSAGRNVTFSWLSSEDSSKLFSSSNLAKLCIAAVNTNNWTILGTPVNVAGTDPRSISATSTKLSSVFTVFDSSYNPSTGIDNSEPIIPSKLSLSQNYPNPFNPSTTIEFTIPDDGNVKVSIYNTLGQKVKELLNENKSAGKIYKLNINAGDFSSGIYYIRLEFENDVLTRKINLIK